jgi:hypothetical protein
VKKEERAQWKEIIKGSAGYEARTALLLYAFHRGMPYRRVERKCSQHNRITSYWLWVSCVHPRSHLLDVSGGPFMFESWLAEGSPVDPPAPKRKDQPVYVIVRNDISKAQQAVQGMHAAQVFAANHPDDYSKRTLVFVTCRHRELLDMKDAFLQRGQEYETFVEPDMDNETTAIAARGGFVRALCQKLPLFSA